MARALVVVALLGACVGPPGRRDSAVIAVAAGEAHTCAQLEDGRLLCLGQGQDGQPAELARLEPVRQLVAGSRYTCALTAAGGVRCWRGQTSRDPVELGGDVVQLAAGALHTCALRADGGVRCWGTGDNGVLGYGTGPPEADVPLGGRAVALAACYLHTCAILEAGAVVCWGYGEGGVLGYGNEQTIGDDETPAEAGALWFGEPAVQITAGDAHTCALFASGSVRCWGSNQFGQLGWDASRVGDDEPATVAPPLQLDGDVRRVVVHGPSCALFDDGRVQCWGRNHAGQLGRKSWQPFSDDPGDVGLGVRAVEVVVGAQHACAITESGALRCWGSNLSGQLGYPGLDAVGDDELPAEIGDVPLP